MRMMIIVTAQSIRLVVQCLISTLLASRDERVCNDGAHRDIDIKKCKVRINLYRPRHILTTPQTSVNVIQLALASVRSTLPLQQRAHSKQTQLSTRSSSNLFLPIVPAYAAGVRAGGPVRGGGGGGDCGSWAGSTGCSRSCSGIHSASNPCGTRAGSTTRVNVSNCGAAASYTTNTDCCMAALCTNPTKYPFSSCRTPWASASAREPSTWTTLEAVARADAGFGTNRISPEPNMSGPCGL
jgi:hypothetical protein